MSNAIRLSMKNSMKLTFPLPSRFAFQAWIACAAALVLAAAFSLPMQAQDGNASGQRKGYVDDWSTHRLLFSNPGTREDAVKHGKLNQWLAVTNSARYQMQQLERNRGVLTGIGTNFSGRFGGRMPVFGSKSNPIHKDWNVPLGGLSSPYTGTIGTLNSSTISSSSTLTIAGAGLPGGTVTLTGSAPTQGTQTGTFTGDPSTGGYVTIKNGTNSLKLTIGAPSAMTIAMHGVPSSGDTVTIGVNGEGSITYEFETNQCSASTNRCVQIPTTGNTTGKEDTTASNLSKAISGTTCYNSGGCPTAGNDPNVVGSYTSGNSVTITNNSTLNTVSVSTTDMTNIYLAGSSQTPVTLAAPSGTNGCTNSTTGTFINPDSTSALATQLATAITNCDTAYTAVGVTATSTGSSGVVTLTADNPGQNTITLSDNLSSFSWAGNLTGTNGTQSAGPTTTPTFTYWSGTTYASPATVAGNICSVLNADDEVNEQVACSVSGGAVVLSVAGSGGGPYTIGSSSFGAISPANGTVSAVPATVQPNAYPAKYGASLTTASCSDYVVFPTGQEGGANSANIIAYTNLYSSCGGTVPSVAWAYNTGTGYAVTTSPSISEDGTSVIFVQSNGTESQLVVLDVLNGSGTLTAPATPGPVVNIGDCTSPTYTACAATIALSGHDTYSAPYYTYFNNDTVFVGTDNGYLDEISPILNGTLGTASTSVQLSGAAYVSSPVFDPSSGCVFVGDTNGYLYSVDPGFGSGTVCNSNTLSQHAQSALLANGALGGIYDGTLVDPSAGTLYAFVASNVAGSKSPTVTVSFYSKTVTFTAGALTTADIGDTIELDSLNILKNYTITAVSGTTATLNNYYFYPGTGSDVLTLKTPAGDNAVDEFPTNFAGGASPSTSAPVGTGGLGYPLYAGTFDNAYYTNDTGNIWVVGGTGTSSTGASLYYIPLSGSSGITGGSTVSHTVTGTNGYPWPSPITEFDNNGTDYLFFSVAGGSPSGCTSTAGNGCILSYTVSGTTATLSGTGQNYAAGCWVSGGIVIDNSATTGGASQLYFVDLNGVAAGGENDGTTINPAGACASGSAATLLGVQASQSNP